ncbi:MAG: DUF4233 domain-containing protein [Actinobacteria bacterium]|jgi:Protein of unknown function (DUF4233)|nr:DUF4233 domain-containing protein [Actinomycetota bacterium]NDA94704.1 DUF4233 domain-containing protein [Actinomycetota bacterium]NDH80601.1 DUF4233 domain-containing protein [Actinomycetota bacterium]NDH99289.1 DUF4233 domain-containing protein [Actinomycetota bacterium]NDI07651.1 DUF4233 domain-containing protein [Actinomycetota bacterium]
MRMLASSVLVMESFVMGFALLLAMKDHTSNVIIIGAVISLLCLLTPGLLKKKIGWILGWVLQIALLAYGFAVTSMFLVGAIFLGLWIAAILVGKKGEAARAALLAAGPPNA